MRWNPRSSGLCQGASASGTSALAAWRTGIRIACKLAAFGEGAESERLPIGSHARNSLWEATRMAEVQRRAEAGRDELRHLRKAAVLRTGTHRIQEERNSAQQVA